MLSVDINETVLPHKNEPGEGGREGRGCGHAQGDGIRYENIRPCRFIANQHRRFMIQKIAGPRASVGRGDPRAKRGHASYSGVVAFLSLQNTDGAVPPGAIL